MPTARDPLYRRHRFPPEVISYAVWLYFRFPLSLRMVEEMLAARGIGVTYETARQWGRKFGKAFSDRIRQRAPARGDKWHLDEVVISIAGEQHWLWRAVDQIDFVLDVLIRRRRDSRAAQRLMKKLLKSAGTPPHVMIADKRSHGAAGEVSSNIASTELSTIGLRILISRRGDTRADDEAFQIAPSGSTVAVNSRSGGHCQPQSCFARASLCDLARDLHDKRYRRISNL
ncbi:putative transposase [Bradyrhizobium liaoningense]